MLKFWKSSLSLDEEEQCFSAGPCFQVILQGHFTPPVTTHRNTVTPEQIYNKFSFDQYFFLHLYHQSGMKSLVVSTACLWLRSKLCHGKNPPVSCLCFLKYFLNTKTPINLLPNESLTQRLMIFPGVWTLGAQGERQEMHAGMRQTLHTSTAIPRTLPSHPSTWRNC